MQCRSGKNIKEIDKIKNLEERGIVATLNPNIESLFEPLSFSLETEIFEALHNDFEFLAFTAL